MELLRLFCVLVLCFALCVNGVDVNVTKRPRPKIVNIGAFFTFNSTIGRVASVAIHTALDDVNADPSVLKGSKLVVDTQDTQCNGFMGIVEGKTPSILIFCSKFIEKKRKKILFCIIFQRMVLFSIAFQFMEADIVAVVGPQCSMIAHTISHIANELQVPLLSFGATDPALSTLQFPFFIRTTQSDLFQMQAVAEIVSYYQWKEVIAIFVDYEYGQNGVSALGDKLAERRCKISFKAALPPEPNRSDVTDLLIKVALMESRVLVLHANPTVSLIVFSVANYLQMMSNGYVWIATDSLTALLDSRAPLSAQIMESMQGVIALRQHTADSKKKSELVARWSGLVKNQTGDNFHINSYGFYAYDTVWILARALDAFFNDGGIVSFSNDSRLRDIQEGNLNLQAMSVFDGGKLLLDKIRQTNMSGVIGSIQFDSNGYLIHPAYDIINVVGTGFRTVGYWSNYSGLSIVPPETLYSKPPNRSSVNQQLHSVIWPGETITKPRGWVFPNNGKELRIGVPNRASYQEFVSEEPHTGTIKGYCIDVFVAAVNLLPYPVPHRFIPFGNGHQNPSYTELVNKIITNVSISKSYWFFCCKIYSC